jgi:hypothetical protein
VGRSGGELHGAAMPEIEGLPDYHCGSGTIPQPGDAFLLEQEEHPGDDQDDGSTARIVSQLHDRLSVMGRGLMAHF